jgi:hypothetical protein
VTPHGFVPAAIGGAVRKLVGIESGVVSGVINLKSPALERRAGDHAMGSNVTKPVSAQPAAEASVELFDS